MNNNLVANLENVIKKFKHQRQASPIEDQGLDQGLDQGDAGPDQGQDDAGPDLAPVKVVHGPGDLLVPKEIVVSFFFFF